MYWPKPDADHLILTARQILDLEGMILSSGLPVEALMEKVGQKMSRWFLDRPGLVSKGVIVLVGPGHNGGDGLVVARELYLAGINVSLWCPLPITKSLTIKQLSYASWIGIKEIKNDLNPSGEELWIEALFGIAQTRPLPGKISQVLKAREENCPGKLVSLDVPAGICSDTGRPLNKKAAHSSFTLTVGFYKSGLLQDAALPFVGHLIRIDLGFSKSLLCQVIQRGPLRICSSDISSFNWPAPSLVSNKYQRGRVLVIAGSDKYPGAAVLAMKGVLASGNGSIKAALPKNMSNTFWQYMPEVLIDGYMESSRNGGVKIGTFLRNYDFNRIDSLLIGPGIGLSDENWSEASYPLQEFEGLITFDADALNRISNTDQGWKWLKKRKGMTVITPHISEFQRLFKSVDLSNPLNAAREAAQLSGTGVLLKGAHSIFAAPSGESWQIGQSAPWVARAGLGDVLAGFIAGVGSIELVTKQTIDWDVIAAAAMLHASAGLDSKKGSTPSSIASVLEANVKKINSLKYLEKDI